MPDIMIVILFGIIGFLSSIVFTAIIYRRSQRELSSLHMEIEKADRDLSEDIKAIGINELQLTEAGREILGLRNVTVGRGIPIRNLTVGREKLMPNHSKYEAKLNIFPLFGSIPAGAPIAALGYPADSVGVDILEIEGRSYKVFGFKMEREIRLSLNVEYFMLKARGHSMNIAKPVAIEDGDYVLLAKMKAQHYDIVAAVIVERGDLATATLKRYHAENGNVVLKSESDGMNMEIPMSRENYVQGVVVAVLKPVDD